MNVVIWCGVALVGGLASVARFVIDRLVTQSTRAGLPVGTLTVNLTGSLVLGVSTAAVLPWDVSLLVNTAAIGSYTTFSTWLFESHRLAEEHNVLPAALNVLLSLVAGTALAGLGFVIGSRLG
jgi:CrcB protein